MASEAVRKSILLWDDNPVWTESFTSGAHRYLIPRRDPPRDYGAAVTQVDLADLRREDVDRQVARIRGRGPASRPKLFTQLARRRVYVHAARWTSLDVGLIQAMYVGLPVVAFASTMASTLVPPEAGVVSADVRTLALATEAFIVDYGSAALAGKASRDYAVAHFSLDRFLAEWEAVIGEFAD